MSGKSIFGHDLSTRSHNGIERSVATTCQFLSFFLFCLCSLPFIYFRPQTIRHLFTVKSYLCSTAGIAFLVWTIVKAGGIGPVVSKKTDMSTSKHAWTFINSTMSALANFSTFIVNAPDFSRLAKQPSSSAIPQLIAIPPCFALTSLIGILASSASAEMYGVTYWSPLDLLDRYIEHNGAGNRAGVFFIQNRNFRQGWCFFQHRFRRSERRGRRHFLISQCGLTTRLPDWRSSNHMSRPRSPTKSRRQQQPASMKTHRRTPCPFPIPSPLP